MTALHSQIMERTGDFHQAIRKACFGVAKDLLDDPTPFDAGKGVFDPAPRPGNDFVQPFISCPPGLACWFFLGWKVSTPLGS